MTERCEATYEGSDTMQHRCNRPKGHAHGHDAYPLSDWYYCNLHGCEGIEREDHMEMEATR